MGWLLYIEVLDYHMRRRIRFVSTRISSSKVDLSVHFYEPFQAQFVVLDGAQQVPSGWCVP